MRALGHRRTVGTVAALLIAGVVCVASGRSAVGAPVEPVLTVQTSPSLGCGLHHRDDGNLDFFQSKGAVLVNNRLTAVVDLSRSACGTFLAVGGRVFGPATTPGALLSFEPIAAFTPLSQSAVTGSGSNTDPFRIVTTAAAGDTGVVVTQTDTWTAWTETLKTRIDVANAAATGTSVVLYRAGDCQESSYVSFGRIAPGKAACVVAVQDGVFQDIGRLVPGAGVIQMAGVGATAMVDAVKFNGVATADGSGPPGFGPLLDAALVAATPLAGGCTRCDPDEAVDRSLGLSWSLDLAASSTATVRTTTTLSTGLFRRPTRLDAAIDPARPDTVSVVLDATPQRSRSGQLLRFLRDGTEVCRALTDSEGRAGCSIAQDLGTTDAAVGLLSAGSIVDVLFAGDLDLRPAGALVQLGPAPADPGPLVPPACLPTEDVVTAIVHGDVNLRVGLGAPGCPTVRYALTRTDGSLLVYLPGNGSTTLDFAMVSGFGDLVVTRFRQPGVVLARVQTNAVAPGKARGG